MTSKTTTVPSTPFAVRDRVKELRRVPARDLHPNPKNWRTHPQPQQDALRGVLTEIGYADALLAREGDGGELILVDGHLRKDTTPDAVVPVLVLDVTEAEANTLLATLDPLAAMAEADKDALDKLLRDVQTGSEAVGAMLKNLAATIPAVPADGDWANVFEQQGDTSGVDDRRQVTFVLASEDHDALMAYLATYGPDKNAAIVQWLTASSSDR